MNVTETVTTFMLKPLCAVGSLQSSDCSAEYWKLMLDQFLMIFYMIIYSSYFEMNG